MTKENWVKEKENIIKEAKKEIQENRFIRYGQAIFNLSRNWFIEVEELRATNYDCFHNDTKVDMFLEELGNIVTNIKEDEVKTEMKKGESWYSVECECPYCYHIQEAMNEDIQCCDSCGKEFEIDEPTL